MLLPGYENTLSVTSIKAGTTGGTLLSIMLSAHYADLFQLP